MNQIAKTYTSHRPLRTFNTGTHSLALFDTGNSFVIESWRYSDDTRQAVDRTDYIGMEDRLAARTMALGTLRSMAYMAARGEVDLDALALYVLEG